MLSRVPKRLSVREDALWAGNERIALISEIEQALVIPPPRPVLRVIAGNTRFELPVEGHINARETVDAIGMGPTRAPLRFRWTGRKFAPMRGLVTGLLGTTVCAGATTVSLTLALAVGCMIPIALRLVASYQPRVEIGCDGIFVVNEAGTCFVPYDIVRSVSMGRIRLKNGGIVRFGDGRLRNIDDEAQDDALAVLAIERIEHALSSKQTKTDGPLVERLAASSPNEIEHLGISYREAPCSDDDLWSVVEEGRSPPAARINAATLLLRRLGKEAKRRIAATAHPTIHPDVREALEALVMKPDGTRE